MSWVKLDDGFWMHPKVVMAGNEGAGIFARCLSYCGAYLTDGKLPNDVALAIAGSPRKLEAVVAVGLLQRLPSGDVYVRDYTDYNPPRDVVEAQQEVRREKAQTAAAARWGKRTNGHHG